MKRVLWVVTGAGCFMRCSAGVFLETSKDVLADVVFTAAGLEVARIYGVLDVFIRHSRHIYYELPASGGVLAGRVAGGFYSLVVVAPATSNTVAKIRHGIADTPPLTAVLQAVKNMIPVVILPTDALAVVETELPCMIEHGLCNGCGSCMETCPAGAIYMADGVAHIDYQKCIGCTRCVEACMRGAIKCWERISVECSPLDLENAWLLARVKPVRLVVNCHELREEIKRLLSGSGEVRSDARCKGGCRHHRR
ncbi:MAG: 4Fe-4S dicluster domain-containing protein [Crenarchaeota archaeon]|nr:4Fe-4S dicluster domain-containing protein [Thermoproteota archaeon]